MSLPFPNHGGIPLYPEEATVIEISSDEETLHEMIASSRADNSQEASTSAQSRFQSQTSAEQDLVEFREFLRNSFPIYWIPVDVRQEFGSIVAHRLRMAAAKNIPIADLYIDENTGALSWDGMEEEGSLHTVLQYSLRLLAISCKLGWFRECFIRRAQARIETALRSGLVTAGELQIVDFLPLQFQIGNSCMTTGSAFMRELREFDVQLAESQSISQGAEFMVHQSIGFSTDARTDHDSVDDADDEHESDASGSDADISDADDSDTSAWHSQVEETERLTNIFDEVEVVGGPEGLITGLEVYLAHEEDEDLPMQEVEAFIDGQAYEQHFGSDEFLELELAHGVEEHSRASFEFLQVPYSTPVAYADPVRRSHVRATPLFPSQPRIARGTSIVQVEDSHTQRQDEESIAVVDTEDNASLIASIESDEEKLADSKNYASSVASEDEKLADSKNYASSVASDEDE